MLASLPWDLAPHLPWRHFTSWSHQWSVQPSFLVGEYLFIALAIVLLVHARACGRDHVLAWVGALVAGTANDLFFMALPLVDNFWQAQATIMLTPRLPLYIPCVYVCFMYLPKVAVWRLGLPRLSTAVATGLCAIAFYAPYDIVGAKFLWWTWHDTDLPIAHRILGAPIGSSMWVITFVAAFSWLLDTAIARAPEGVGVDGRTFVRGLAFVALFSTPIMMLQLTVLQQLDAGIPGPRGLVVVATIYAALAVRGWRGRVSSPRPAGDRLLRVAVPVYYLVLTAIVALFDPATHVATGVHQTYGPCHVPASDIVGLQRYEFLCAEDFSEDFTFACVDRLPADHTEWYTVCGRDFPTGRSRWLFAVAGLGVLGIALYSWLLSARARR
jgi:hypothetical protein